MSDKRLIGPEFMRQLCALNAQFASSVLEDYIRPIVQDEDVVLEIECGNNSALLYLSKLCQGSKGPCIWFQDAWLTPNEFQYISGRETAKDWKRSIRHCGKSMKLLLTKGILSTHPPICDCDGCRISSPVNRLRLSDIRKHEASLDNQPCQWWLSRFEANHSPLRSNQRTHDPDCHPLSREDDEDSKPELHSPGEEDVEAHHLLPLCKVRPCNRQALDMSQWSVEEVCHFVRSLVGEHSDIEDSFRAQNIDGHGLLLLTEDHLVDTLSIALGHALKIIVAIQNRINFCRQCNHCLSCHN